ncbi:MAG: acyl carrier protein [Alphaproteobacteria bacterium]|nr:acyl carrier protein [Alphaproteobacteria bacterium]
MAGLESDVIEIIAKQVNRDPATVKRDDRLADLDIQSLDVAEIIFAIEEKFDIEVPYNANDTSAAGINFDTVGDVADGIAKLVAKKK